MKNNNLYLMMSLPALSLFSSLSCLAVRATPSLSSLSFLQAVCLLLHFGVTGSLFTLLFLLANKQEWSSVFSSLCS